MPVRLTTLTTILIVAACSTVWLPMSLPIGGLNLRASQLVLVPVLVIMVNLLLMTLFSRSVTSALAITDATEVAQAFPFLAMGLICLLALASVLSVAAGLAGGVALSSFGMGRFTGGLLKHGARKLIGAAARPVTWAGKKAGRAGWQTYQNRQRNSVSRAPTPAPRPATATRQNARHSFPT